MESLSPATRLFSAMLLSGLAASAPAHGSDRGGTIDGPVRAQVIRVIDGDTLLVAAKPWPQQTMEVYVRLRGIDAPEIKSRCAATRTAGERAQAALATLAGEHAEIRLMQIAGDKYFGRVLANILLDDGRNPAQELLSGGYVRDYEGGRKAQERCASFW